MITMLENRSNDDHNGQCIQPVSNCSFEGSDGKGMNRQTYNHANIGIKIMWRKNLRMCMPHNHASISFYLASASHNTLKHSKHNLRSIHVREMSLNVNYIFIKVDINGEKETFKTVVNEYCILIKAGTESEHKIHLKLLKLAYE